MIYRGIAEGAAGGYNAAMRPTLVISLFTLFASGCGSAAPRHAAKALWFDAERPITVKIEKVKLPDEETRSAWWAFLPAVLCGTSYSDAASAEESTIKATIGSAIKEQHPGLCDNRSYLADALTLNFVECLGCAGLFKSVVMDGDAAAVLKMEFTRFRMNTRLYAYGITPLGAAPSFWLLGCPVYGVWFEFKINAQLVGADGKQLWKGNAAGSSRIFYSTWWQRITPEQEAFYDGYILLLSDFFKELDAELPPPDDPVWQALPHRPGAQKDEAGERVNGRHVYA